MPACSAYRRKKRLSITVDIKTIDVMAEPQLLVCRTGDESDLARVFHPNERRFRFMHDADPDRMRDITVIRDRLARLYNFGIPSELPHRDADPPVRHEVIDLLVQYCCRRGRVNIPPQMRLSKILPRGGWILVSEGGKDPPRG